MRIVILAALALAWTTSAQAQSLAKAEQAKRCEAQWRMIKDKGPVGAGEQAAFIKACLSDVSTIAALPGDITMNAPAGATGLCRDGHYTASVKREDACVGHGGLSRWIS